jgi:proline iminopeptidase
MKKLLMIIPLVILLCFTFCCQQGEEVAGEGEEPVETEAKTEVSSGFVKVNEAEIFYQIEGHGIPMMVPNVMGTLAHQLSFSKDIRQDFQLILVDLYGGGKSVSGPIEKITRETLVDSLEQVRSELKLDKILLFGHSNGVILSLEYIKKYPQNVSHLILLGAGPKWWQFDDYVKTQQVYWDSFASDDRKKILQANQEELQLNNLTSVEDLRRFYRAHAPRFFYNPRYDGSHLVLDSIRMDVMTHVFNDVWKDYDATSFLSLIRCPVLILIGRYDFQNPPTLWDDEKEKFPDYTFYVFEESGHFPMFEEQELFDKKLIDWVKSH